MTSHMHPVDLLAASKRRGNELAYGASVSTAPKNTTQGVNNTLSAAIELAKLAAYLKRIVEQAKL